MEERIEDHSVNTCPDITQAPGFRATQWPGLRKVVERIEDHWVNTLPRHHAGSRVSCNTMAREERIEDHWVNTLPRHHAGSRVLCNTMARTEGGGGAKDRGPLGQHLAQTGQHLAQSLRRLQGFVQPGSCRVADT